MVPAAIVTGCSSGGLVALQELLGALPSSTPPVAIVMHRAASNEDALSAALQHHCALSVQEANEKTTMQAGSVYLAPADYHLLVERDRTLALSVDPKVHHCRPAIDVFFESAAEAFGAGLIGIIMSGANCDGAAGLRAVKMYGGTAWVQDPDRAHFPTMPRAALEATTVDRVGSPREFAAQLSGLAGGKPR